MLTYNKNSKCKRKDLPWLLVILVLTWIVGPALFHSPWEPFEPFVFAVVKNILLDNSWLVPYVSHVPYLRIQPFYFWFYAAILKLFNVHNIHSIANTVRLINTMVICAVVILVSRIGLGLSAFKNGRTVVLLLISSIGFINLSYQISPNLIVLLGFCLYLYALQLHQQLPGISGWLLFIGLLFVSIAFNCEFILIALLILIVLPMCDSYWRNQRYLVTCIISISLFSIIFYVYCYQLQQVNKDFFWQWKIRYMEIYNLRHYNILRNIKETVILLCWFLIPSYLLVIWTIYKRRLAIFKDKNIQVNILLIGFLLISSLFSGHAVDESIFPIVIPFVFIASLEIDSIRISIVSLLNWFSIFIFGTLGIIIWLIYTILNLGLISRLAPQLLSLTQNFHNKFEFWQLFLAIVITLIWLFMITRRHIRGREMVTNWASGTTFILVLFMTLCLPWFDSILTFKPLVEDSLKYINKKSCLVTNSTDTVQGALWYYYADINLLPAFINFDFSVCNQALIATSDPNSINKKSWNIMWRAKRPVDKQQYFLLKHK